MTTEPDLRKTMDSMAPWHHRVKIRDGIFTSSATTANHKNQLVNLINTKESFLRSTRHVLPDGMKGRSFLDCACNAGGYCFAAKDRGAGRVYGFDIRDHWINQAKFIQNNREADSSGMIFEVADLLDFSRDGETYDVTWFSGIFYHLPDPVASLKLAADRTTELLFLNTAVSTIEDGQEEAPGMQFKSEGTEQVMSGIHQLSWLPSGPKVLNGILNWLGFVETRTYYYVSKQSDHRNPQAVSRIGIVAAREKGRLSNVPHISHAAKRTR